VAGVSDGSGLQAAHWSELGAGDASDLDIMSYAEAHDYIVLTHDLDFAAILAATHGKKPSVVQIRAEQLAPDLIGLSDRTLCRRSGSWPSSWTPGPWLQ
jgi:predicted nuclease of predicted toxin-antitoxin system